MVELEWKMTGQASLSNFKDKIMKMYGGFSWKPLGSYEQSNFYQLIAKLKVFMTSQWNWIEKIQPYIFKFCHQ